ncbi:hypothetical protein [Bacillus suaedae]|uniref:Uncharacterized protein n=1 Tax=Halalkalibacter suaedae TaxID=2822140 RepID=A0A940WYJ0_9BACI|nr:hypothetical protein [Bacillus suaedae]MBP3953088.1 hypothetical protein [Bacillus suaedae]
MPSTQWKEINEIFNESERLVDTNKQLDEEIRLFRTQSELNFGVKKSTPNVKLKRGSYFGSRKSR